MYLVLLRGEDARAKMRPSPPALMPFPAQIHRTIGQLGMNITEPNGTVTQVIAPPFSLSVFPVFPQRHGTIGSGSSPRRPRLVSTRLDGRTYSIRGCRGMRVSRAHFFPKVYQDSNQDSKDVTIVVFAARFLVGLGSYITLKRPFFSQDSSYMRRTEHESCLHRS